MKWIKIEDNVPEQGEKVLWYDAMFNKVHAFALDFPEMHDGDYTHWMQLPEPPAKSDTPLLDQLEPIKKWPCSVCGKTVLHPNWFMETTLCEEHINTTDKEFTSEPQPWMCECGHMNNKTWLRCDNCRRHRPDDEIS